MVALLCGILIAVVVAMVILAALPFMGVGI